MCWFRGGTLGCWMSTNVSRCVRAGRYLVRVCLWLRRWFSNIVITRNVGRFYFGHIYSETCLKRACSKAVTSLKQTWLFAPKCTCPGQSFISITSKADACPKRAKLLPHCVLDSLFCMFKIFSSRSIKTSDIFRGLHLLLNFFLDIKNLS